MSDGIVSVALPPSRMSCRPSVQPAITAESGNETVSLPDQDEIQREKKGRSSLVSRGGRSGRSHTKMSSHHHRMWYVNTASVPSGDRRIKNGSVNEPAYVMHLDRIQLCRHYSRTGHGLLVHQTSLGLNAPRLCRCHPMIHCNIHI